MKIKFYLALLHSLFLFSSFSLMPFMNFSAYLPSFPKLSLYEERWNWNDIATTNVSFPRNFIWGTGDSAFQTEGRVTVNGNLIQNSWTQWEEQIIKKNGLLQSRVPLEKRATTGCERWTRYPDDLKLAKEIGMNAHRFSIEWSKVEPKKGVFDDAAMQHYIDYTWAMVKNGLTPIPTLFHHTWPLWFEYSNQKTQDLAFEDARNIHDFVEFALYVLNAYKKAGLLEHVRMWLTFNEPIGYVLAAYVDGKLPPGKKFNLKLSGIVAKNMLDAHIAVYDAFKKVDPRLKISFAHMMQPIQPYYPLNPLDYLPAKIFDYLINDVALEYFKTGNFYWLNTVGWEDLTIKNLIRKIRSLNFNLGVFTTIHNPNALGKLDFIGVNYYTHTLLKFFNQAARPDEKLADNYPVPMIKAIYPEGFYQSLKKASKLGVPILVTENGFAATQKLREEFLQKHLYVIYKAMQEGMDIRGYLFWTLTDCFGWNSGQHSRHGIFAVDFETQQRTFRPSAQYLIDVINTKSFAKPIEPLYSNQQSVGIKAR